MEKDYFLNKTPLISIIIPTYNRAHIIIETIESILSQTYKNWECIIVDDGSSDETEELIAKYSKNDNRFKFHKRPFSNKKGPSGCRNYGLDKAIGDYVMFLDSDDLLKPFCLEQRIKYFYQYPDCDFLIFQTELFQEIPGDLKKIPNVLHKDLDDLSRFISFDYPWNIIAPIYNAKTFEGSKIKWDEDIEMHEDIDFHIRLLCSQPAYKKITSAPDVYIRMGNSDKNSLEANSIKSLESNVRLLTNIKKYLGWLDCLKPETFSRLYGLSIHYSKLFYDSKRIDLIKATAKIMETSFFLFINDLKYYLSTKKERSFRLYLYQKLYNLTGVKKRLQFAYMKNSTLAKYKVNEERYHYLKVLHVATSHTGGAGIAAYRLHKGLKDIGVPSNFVTLRKDGSQFNDVYRYKNPKPSLLQLVKNKIWNTKKFENYKSQIAKLPNGYEGYSLAESPYFLEKHRLIEDADIIHLHWVGGFINIPTFFKTIKKPVVWTLHDMNPFQGGFHYKNDEINYSHYIEELEKKVILQKQKGYNKSTLLHIVAPSKWLMNQSKQSKLLGRFNHSQIFNGVDKQIFKIYNKQDARKTFNLNEDKIILLFASETVNNKRKGYDILIQSLKGIKGKESIQLVAIGNPPNNKEGEINYLGTITDPEQLAKLFSAAHFYLLPSREDNLPNVMLEALMCGTPVIATPVGGMLEVINPGFNGFLAEDLTAKGFAKAIEKGILEIDNFNSEKIRQNAVQKFTLHNQANEYIKLYTKLILASNTFN